MIRPYDRRATKGWRRRAARRARKSAAAIEQAFARMSLDAMLAELGRLWAEAMAAFERALMTWRGGPTLTIELLDDPPPEAPCSASAT